MSGGNTIISHSSFVIPKSFVIPNGDNMKIAVVGAGAMGSLFGALLAEAGSEVGCMTCGLHT